MKYILTLAITILIGLPISAQGSSKNFIDQAYIEVTGKAELELTPDIIHLKVIIREKDNKGKVALEELEEQMMKALKKIGIKTQEDVSIIDFASNFQFYTLKKTDIRTSKEYQIVIHNGNMAAKVYTELEKLDISNISVVKLDHSKMEYHRQQVKIEAVKEAKNKATAFCSAIGEKAGKALYIRENNRIHYAGRVNRMESNVMMSISDHENTPEEVNIDFQKLKLEYEIEAKFAIE